MVAAGFHCRFGEIDLIVKDKKFLVFVEVKTRKSVDFGTPGEFVDYRKQEKIKMVAQEFLRTYDKDTDIRFDVIEVMAESSLFGGFRVKEINHIEQAF